MLVWNEKKVVDKLTEFFNAYAFINALKCLLINLYKRIEAGVVSDFVIQRVQWPVRISRHLPNDSDRGTSSLGLAFIRGGSAGIEYYRWWDVIKTPSWPGDDFPYNNAAYKRIRTRDIKVRASQERKWLPQFSLAFGNRENPCSSHRDRSARDVTSLSSIIFLSLSSFLDCGTTTRREYLRNPRALWIINVLSVHNRTRRRYVGQNKAFFISRKLRVATRRILRTENVNNDVRNYRTVRSKILGEKVNENLVFPVIS